MWFGAFVALLIVLTKAITVLVCPQRACLCCALWGSKSDTELNNLDSVMPDSGTRTTQSPSSLNWH